MIRAPSASAGLFNPSLALGALIGARAFGLGMAPGAAPPTAS